MIKLDEVHLQYYNYISRNGPIIIEDFSSSQNDIAEHLFSLGLLVKTGKLSSLRSNKFADSWACATPEEIIKFRIRNG
jgi:hypothetical protein